MLDVAYTGVKYHPRSSSGGLDGIVFGKDEKEGRRGGRWLFRSSDSGYNWQLLCVFCSKLEGMEERCR
ncbi:unnamed protein product, partial [Ectocarpus sp. 8 AP-2014]